MNIAKILLFPPVVFSIFLMVGLMLNGLGALIAAKGTASSGKKTQYACGEDVPAEKVQPDYAAFFPFALFFTILHVTALILATLPNGNIALMGILYMAGVALALYTLVVR
jgi:NADH:ubiquinone oxidoreductase subunit 3 (subunit A)